MSQRTYYVLVVPIIGGYMASCGKCGWTIRGVDYSPLLIAGRAHDRAHGKVEDQ